MKEYGFPEASDYLSLAKATVECIRNQQEVRSENNEFCSSIDQLYSQLSNKKATGFHFNGILCSIIDDHEHNVRVGGKVGFLHGELQEQSYWIEVFGKKNSNYSTKILYRIHFDVAVPDIDKNKELHPLYHVQSGGKPRNTHYINDEMQHWSIPRIPYFPLSLALFLEIVFREFGGELVRNRFIKSNAWRRIVANNERRMLSAFAKTFRQVWSKSQTVSGIYYEGF